MKIPAILSLNKKKIVILFILGLVLFLGFNIFTGQKQTPLQFASVKKQDIKTTVSASGSLTGKNTANLKFKSSGRLIFLNVSPGDIVFAGQMIAGLDTQDLNIALKQAQNTLRDKQAVAEKILDDVKDHDKDETFTQKQNRTTAEVARDNAFDSVKENQRDFQDRVIISPVNGLVTQVSQIVGQNVSSSDLIAQVVETADILFDAKVDEADLGLVSPGFEAEITLDAYPDKIFKARVVQIIPAVKTTSQGASVVTARIKLENLEFGFINGLTGQASIISKEATNVLTIPQEALREDNTVILSANLRPQKIVPGIKSDTDVEIKEGLKEGDHVLLNPPAQGAGLNSGRSNPLSRFFRFPGGGRNR